MPELSVVVGTIQVTVTLGLPLSAVPVRSPGQLLMTGFSASENMTFHIFTYFPSFIIKFNL